jgi:hypothetical protein
MCERNILRTDERCSTFFEETLDCQPVKLADEKIFGSFIEEIGIPITNHSAEEETSVVAAFAERAGFSREQPGEKTIPPLDAIVASMEELTKNVRKHAGGVGWLTVRRYEQGLEVICEDNGPPIQDFRVAISKDRGLAQIVLINDIVILQSSEHWRQKALDDSFKSLLPWQGNRVILRNLSS